MNTLELTTMEVSFVKLALADYKDKHGFASSVEASAFGDLLEKIYDANN